MIVVAQATDSTFGAKLRENLHSNQRFKYDPKRLTDEFIVEHYAGPVTYSCTKFLDKNKDTLSTGQHTWPKLALTIRKAHLAAVQHTQTRAVRMCYLCVGENNKRLM